MICSNSWGALLTSILVLLACGCLLSAATPTPTALQGQWRPIRSTTPELARPRTTRHLVRRAGAESENSPPGGHVHTRTYSYAVLMHGQARCLCARTEEHCQPVWGCMRSARGHGRAPSLRLGVATPPPLPPPDPDSTRTRNPPGCRRIVMEAGRPLRTLTGPWGLA